MSDTSSEEIVSDSFEEENAEPTKVLSSDNSDLKVTPTNKSHNESTVIRSSRKKKINVITSDTEDDELEHCADDSYRFFAIHPIGRSSVLPPTKETCASIQSQRKSVIVSSTRTADMDLNEKQSAENVNKSIVYEDDEVPEKIIEATGSDDVVEVSSDEEIPVSTPKVLKQMTLNFNRTDKIKEGNLNNLEKIPSLVVSIGDDDDSVKVVSDNINKLSLEKNEVIETVVSAKVYREQGRKVQELLQNFLKAEKAIKTINLENLPDKGEQLKKRHRRLKEDLDKEQNIFKEMTVHNDNPAKPVAWEDLQLGSVAVQPKTFGQQALQTYNTQKAVTMDRLQQLHGSLNTAPDENTFADPPKKLKVELMPHQKRALAWLMWREKQKPSGGILADDMGLGKTLTMISLILKHKQEQEDNENDGDSSDDEENIERRDCKYNGGTLVVCPASLVQQWDGEVGKHVKKNVLAIELYYGNNRETRAKRLARQDMVITTYGLVKNDSDKNGPLFNVRWRRIILDEAHQIRNHKTQSSIAVCSLSAKSRWALTGTPVHNKELDLYSLLKFLRCSPFDDLAVWKRWIDKKDTGGQQRLNTVIASLLLRRTKEQLHQKGALDCLPQKQWDLLTVNFDKEELNVYQKILLFSKALFSQFLHQRAEKNADRAMMGYGPNADNPQVEYMKMHKTLKMRMNIKDVKQTDILVLLLRLRQICCHPSLITGMLSEGEYDGLSEDEQLEENILDRLQNLTLTEDNHTETQNVADGLSAGQEEVPLAEAVKNILNPSNPIFSKERKSSKVNAILGHLKNIMSAGDKAIVVSQWPTLLRLIAIHLKEFGIDFDQFDGSLPILKRQEVVSKFNDPYSKTKVLLLSLTAGGVGLNLVGANHLLLTDLHWNPQLEQQAQDRIYRVGQKKSVNIYKFMVVDSIEERIKVLQDKKLEIAENVLTGAKSNRNKLSLDDLKMLFEM